MKTFLLSLLLIFVSTGAQADASTELQQRLAKVTHFHANFTQNITDDKKNVLQSGTGEIWLQRPGLFNLVLTKPDESRLVTDGKILWFYNPQIEQVTITWLKEAAEDTPFILVASNRAEDWGKYSVEQNGDNFTLTPKTATGNLDVFNIRVSGNGTIQQFGTMGKDGRSNNYSLTNQDNSAIAADKFLFTPPKGVTIDDQRQ